MADEPSGAALAGVQQGGFQMTDPNHLSRPARTYLLYFLTVVSTANFLDRFVLSILLEDIKKDIGLNDTQLGLLTGISFTLFYALLGIPIARMADRRNRITIVGITTAIWSVAVGITGFCSSFWQLLLVRIGVATGEAGCLPTAHSLIADYFDRSERPSAMARYAVGVPLAMIIGYPLGGWLNDAVGWRYTFMLIGFPGLVLAALAWMTLKDPVRWVRKDSHQSSHTRPDHIPTVMVLGYLARQRTFVLVLVAYCIWYFFGYGLLQWQPSFLIRSFGLTTQTVGLWLLLVRGITEFAGTLAGGALCSKYAAGNEKRQLRGVALALSCYALFSTLGYMSESYKLSFAFFAIAGLLGSMANGPVYSVIQGIVPVRMRATSVALIMFCANLVGMGLGPLAVGAMSDALALQHGDSSLGLVLALFSPGYFLAGLILFVTSAKVAEAVGKAENWKCGS